MTTPILTLPRNLTGEKLFSPCSPMFLKRIGRYIVPVMNPDGYLYTQVKI